jgi:tetratricopeptide (TPR) repeat protein
LSVQRSLFPEAFEIQERALAALDELDLEGALALVEEARECDPLLVNLEPLADAIAWLHRELGSEAPSDELLAALFLTVPAACQRGALDREAAALADLVIARRALRSTTARAFLDREECVHVGALLLVLRRDSEALDLLRESLGSGHDDRADLWACCADALAAAERSDEANAAYVRALLLSAQDVDLFRLRSPALAALHGELLLHHTAASARELLFVQAWLRGHLAIPPDNGWLDRHLSRLHLAAVARPDSPPEQRHRRFALLLYLDRSRPPGRCDEADREEMQALAPELFARVVEHIGEVERRATVPMRW